ncbi:DUF2889 domain-containing protein [Aromatoleum petrolei]|nr:DUF2889 domain-containing protein [Aromatoleum petrolei]
MRPRDIYRRRIRVKTDTGEARADLEDDPHRYGVTVRHDSVRVVAVEGLALRTPWSLCASAAAALSRLEGMPLTTDFTNVYRYIDGSMQCTHMLDMAGLAIAHAARGIRLREYDFEITWSEGQEQQFATMYVDGVNFLNWTVQDTRILSPTPFAGQNLRTMKPWIEVNFNDPDELEALMLFRRAIHISGSRSLDLDALPNAAATGHTIGACYVFQPGVAEHALRMHGTTRDFGDSPERLLMDLDRIS